FIDVGLRIGPYLNSSVQRLSLLMYFGLGPTVGLGIGLCVGVYVLLASLIYRFLRGRLSRVVSTSAASFLVFVAQIGLLGLVLNRVRAVHRYIIAQMREAEEIDQMRSWLLGHERLVSDFVAIALAGACSVAWLIASTSKGIGRVGRAVWLLILACMLVSAYYINSRIEVQQYDHSLHLSMFLLEMVLAMAWLGTLAVSYPRLW